MKQKIIIITLAVLSIFGVIAIFILLPKRTTPNNPSQNSNQYQLFINDYNNTLYATLFKNNQSTELDAKTLPQYGIVSFNSPRDIMYTQRTKPFNLVSATSTTNNQVSIDQITGASIDVLSGQRNNLSITCQ